MKIRPVGPKCSMRMEGQADKQRNMTKLKVAFRNFPNVSKKLTWIASNRNELNYYSHIV